MERYIGQDQRAASTTFAVLGESGKRLGSHVVETNGQALVEQRKTIPGKRHVCLEEGTRARGSTRSSRRMPRKSS